MVEAEPTHEILWLPVALELAPSHNKGLVYETRFEAALQELQDESIITSWRKTPKDEEEDLYGRDYFIVYQGVEIPWSITSTSLKRRRHLDVNYYLDRGEIPVTHIRWKDPVFKTTGLKSVGRLKKEIVKKSEKYLAGGYSY